MITIHEAKKILGKRYSHLTDKEIEGIVVLIYNLCRRVILAVTDNKKYVVDIPEKCYN